MSTTAAPTYTAHRYVDAREIEPGTIIVDPDLGRVEFVEFREAPANPSRGAITVCGLRGPQSVEFVVLRDRDFHFPRVCVEGEFTEREIEQIDRHAESIMSGQTFRLVAASERSAIGYRPPSSTRSYAQALAALAAGATNDRQACLVRAAVNSLVPHALTPEENVARMYDAVADELGRGWFDTIRNASPEPGRRSSNEHEFTLVDRLTILVTLAKAQSAYPTGAGGRLGWCADALCRAHHVRVA